MSSPAFASRVLPSHVPQGARGGALAPGRRLPSLLGAARRRLTSPLRQAEDSAAVAPSDPTDWDKVSKKAGNASWLAWWAQTILSVVSGVTIFFANAVKGAGQGNIIANGILLASVGLALSFINVFWTWGYSRMSSKLATDSDPKGQARKLRGVIKFGVIIALSGMLVTLFGAEQIVGTMVAKAITGSLLFSSTTAQGAATGMQLQALDIFVVQANTNTLLAHLASVINSLYITTLLP